MDILSKEYNRRREIVAKLKALNEILPEIDGLYRFYGADKKKLTLEICRLEDELNSLDQGQLILD